MKISDVILQKKSLIFKNVTKNMLFYKNQI